MLHDKLDIPMPRRADKASFLKIVSIYNDGHSIVIIFIIAFRWRHQLFFLNGSISDITGNLTEEFFVPVY